MNEQHQFKNELRKDTGPDLDFDRLDRMEAALMARVGRETSRRKLRSRVGVGIGVLAMAAAAALVVTRSAYLHRVETPEQAGVAVADPGAGELESGSQVSIRSGAGTNSHVLAHGERLQRGDELETSRAVFRASGRVVFAVSSASGMSGAAEPARVSVTATDRPIVLSLSRGVVEAQVDKVASGEAFAVDVPGDDRNSVRIAVHGTHLRVARENGHVTLDLTEGIVNVGRAPKSGSTYGKLVTAPAHVEFDVASLETSFTMTKDVDKVRVAEDLSPAVTGALEPQALEPKVTSPVLPSQGPVARSMERTPGIAVAPAQQPAQNAPKDPGVVQAPVEPRVDARTAINDAIATCALEKLRNTPATTPDGPGGANAVTVMLNSTLSLRVGDDGYVQAARFEPPLDPAVQKCAASTIYKVHFTDANLSTVMMPISLKTPSP